MMDFDTYVRQSEPDKREKGLIWQTAIGLQAVDGLTPSDFLLDIARQNIEGDITFAEVKNRIDSYYKKSFFSRKKSDDRTEEADKVSARIAEILSERAFSLSPVEYIGIHRRLFDGIYKFAGKIRDYNIEKAEWVLDGATVQYSSAALIRETLEYDFREEKKFSYKGLSRQEQVEHITKFISGLWQIHPFGEGNTRTTAVFAIKYLRTFGFTVENEPFAAHSWYFRNALVRANYSDRAKNIVATRQYLNRFFNNVLFGETYPLKNRQMHIQWDTYVEKLSANNPVKGGDDAVPDTVNDPVKVGDDTVFDTVNDTVFELVKSYPNITAEEIRIKLGIGIATAKRRIKVLKDTGRIERVGSDKTGHWVVKN